MNMCSFLISTICYLRISPDATIRFISLYTIKSISLQEHNEVLVWWLLLWVKICILTYILRAIVAGLMQFSRFLEIENCDLIQIFKLCDKDSRAFPSRALYFSIFFLFLSSIPRLCPAYLYHIFSPIYDENTSRKLSCCRRQKLPKCQQVGVCGVPLVSLAIDQRLRRLVLWRRDPQCFKFAVKFL